MNSTEAHERAEVEKVMADEKLLTTLEALKVRVAQHEKAFIVAKTRIDACLDLAGRFPAEAKLLAGVIAIWERNREYHARILEESRRLGAEIARSLP